ncbi:MAG: (2Fe-2S) ferredoxin domain-containing protein [Clostridia bacterium]|nr:(2Fe-2S) ferredoxin domain-containing protein [Clostridia bacterium]
MKSLAELEQIRNKMAAKINVRSETDGDIRIVVGMATCGIAAGARPVLAAMMEEIEKRGLTNAYVTQTGCVGMCKYEPIVEVYDADGTKTTYIKMDAAKAVRVINEHVVNGNVVSEFTIGAAN